MSKHIMAATTFIIGALMGFALQSVIAQEPTSGTRTWDIYHSAMEGSGNFYIARVDRQTGQTWVATNGNDYNLLKDN